MLASAQRRALFWAPIVLVLIVALVLLFRPSPVLVDFATITRGPLRVMVSDEGETRVKDLFVVSAPVPGFMRRIELEAGDAVSAQQTVIARIEPGDPALLDPRTAAEARATVRAAQAARANAAAALRRAQADAEFAASEAQRVRALAERKLVSISEAQAAQRASRSAQAALEQARAGLRTQEFELQRAQARVSTPNARRADPANSGDGDCECVQVYSPVSGRVLRVVNESEGMVNAGAPLVEVADPQQLEIAVDLLSTDAVRVRAGQRVLIDAWGGERALQGVVRRVEPFGFTKISALGIEEQRVNVIIDFQGTPAQRSVLGHGYRVEPHIVLWESSDVLKVPLAALFRDGQRWAVFVHDNGRARLRHLRLGEQNELAAQVLEGLKTGEQVVLQPGDRVSAGARLRQRKIG